MHGRARGPGFLFGRSCGAPRRRADGVRRSGGRWLAAVQHTSLANPRPEPQLPRTMARTLTRPYWEQATTALQWRVNLAAWLDVFAPLMFFLSVGSSLLLFGLRRAEGPEWAAWGATAAGSLALALWAWWRARAGFFQRTDARVYLERHLGLNAALSAACEGVIGWPDRPSALPALLRWRAGPAAGWLTGAALLLAAANLLPLPRSDSVRPVEKPPALAQTEELLADLASAQVAAPESVEPLIEQARELGARPLEQQYSHGGLEAADALRDQSMNAVDQLARGLEAAASALAPLEAGAGGLGDEQVGGASEQLGAALQGLKNGRLKPNENLLSQLSATGGGNLKGLSPSELSRLRGALTAASAELQRLLAENGGTARITGPGGANTGEGEQPGQGGINRGRGDAPLSFSAESAPKQEGQAQALGTDDLARAAVGDMVGVTRDRPEVDAGKLTQPGSAGAVAGPASGGEAVWVNRLTPAERKVLKEFFK